MLGIEPGYPMNRSRFGKSFFKRRDRCRGNCVEIGCIARPAVCSDGIHFVKREWMYRVFPGPAKKGRGAKRGRRTRRFRVSTGTGESNPGMGGESRWKRRRGRGKDGTRLVGVEQEERRRITKSLLLISDRISHASNFPPVYFSLPETCRLKRLVETAELISCAY